MSAQHTPGPWSYRSQPHDDWGTVRAGRYIICQARNPAVDYDDLDEYRRTRTDPYEANARLIAAAPDLLEACEALIAYDEGDDDAPDAGVKMMIDYDHALTLARAAIAKARGEAA